MKTLSNQNVLAGPKKHILKPNSVHFHPGENLGKSQNVRSIDSS